MAELTLLPRKEFEILTNEGEKIKGQFGTWALKRFCDKQKYSLKQAGEHLGDPAMSDVVEYILCAVEYTARKSSAAFSYTDLHACDWIDQLGGMQSENFTKLFSHSGDEQPETEEKKTQDSDT